MSVRRWRVVEKTCGGRWKHTLVTPGLDPQHRLEYMRGFWGKYVRATSLLILASTVPSGHSVLLPSSFFTLKTLYIKKNPNRTARALAVLL